MYQFQIYTGKADSGNVSTDLGGKVVLHLCESLKGSNSHIAFDNFFSSYELMETLHNWNIYATATVRCNRKNLPVLARSATKLERGEYKWKTKDSTSYIRWKDTKDVHILSTAFNPATTGTVKRTMKDGSTSHVSCPQAVFEYTQRMGGVDRFDERRGRYNVSSRSRRWWMRIFYFLVDCSVVNAHILFNSVHPQEPMTMFQFRKTLFRELVGSFSSRSRRASLEGLYRPKHKALPLKPTGVPTEVRLTSVGVHMPQLMSVIRRCRLCSSRKNNKRSRIKCSFCGVALCVTPCFYNFHK
jgi:hypothetical protein